MFDSWLLFGGSLKSSSLIYLCLISCNSFKGAFLRDDPEHDLTDDIQQSGNIPSYFDYLEETEHRFELNTIECSKVFSLLSKLCKSKATGLDKISPRLLRECADLVASSLCCIFNRSITSGIFPTEWKFTKVVPLFKQGERSDLRLPYTFGGVSRLNDIAQSE